MSLIRYEPWGLLNQLHNEVNRLFDLRPLAGNDEANIVTSDWVPAVDIKEESDRFVIHADVPGVDPKDIEITMENGLLSIKGERSLENKEEREGYRRVERVRGTFYRRFSLPDTADASQITAREKHGVLEIVIPKKEHVQPRKILVQA